MLFPSRFALFFLLATLLSLSKSEAQIRITFPVSRMVIQRDNSNQAAVQIAGSYNQAIDAVEAHVVVRTQGQGTSTNWTPLQTVANGQFNGTISVMGGWYTVEVRGKRNGQVVALDAVDRFGVGEVFAIMGHSNAQGSSCMVDGVDRCMTRPGATDDRVSVMVLDQGTTNFQQYLNTANTDLLPGLSYPATFGKLPTNPGASPFGNFAWLWGEFGDKMVTQTNVPILIYNAGFGGSNMQQTYWAASDIAFSHGFIKYSIRMPYANVRNLMNLYVPSTGIRAMLIQHGENDRSNPTDSTAKYYKGVINKIRSEFSKPNLAMIIAYSSYVSGVFSNVRDAQSRVINEAGYNCYAGPDLDNINSGDDRPDGLHFSSSGQEKAGDAWAASITNAYLATITPYPAEPTPLTTLACAGAGQLTLTKPASASATWTTGAATPSITIGPGTYAVRARSATNKIQFSPAVIVPSGVKPLTPFISTPNETTTICQSALTLTASDSSVLWNTGATTSAINVSTAGNYSVKAIHPVYGCSSGTTSTAIGLAPADIVLNYVSSSKVVSVGEPVTLRLFLQNNSGCNTGEIRWQAPLPPNVAFVSSSIPLTNTNGLLTGSISSLPAFSSLAQEFTVNHLTNGNYQYRAELLSSTNPTPRASPGNGNGNGEVDETALDMRTLQAGGPSYVSSNPNQVPLPSVQSNQPAPNPAKADLSLSMRLSSRVATPGTAIRLVLTVTNSGGLTATGITIGSTLPTGLSFFSSLADIEAIGQEVTGQIARIPAGESVQLTLTLAVTATGQFSIPAQITASGQPDPDSTPGNGYTTGEDDTAFIDLRTQN